MGGSNWRRILYLGISLFSIEAISQNPFIFSNDKYSGISAVDISPTQPYLNPNFWDFQLFSEDLFFQNTYAYISKKSFLGLANGEIEIADREEGITGERKKGVLDYFNFQQTGYHFSSELMGPSLSFRFRIKEQKVNVGFFTKLRTQSSTLKAENYLQFTNQEIVEPETYTMKPFESSFMNWTEIGFNASTELFTQSSYQWIAGLNLKYAMGLDGFYLQNKQNALMRRTYEPSIDNPENEVKTLYISDFNVEMGYATSYDFETDRYVYDPKGKGFGLDLGIAMIERIDDEDYAFKLNLNLLDIGFVNFTGFVHDFHGENLKYVNSPVFDNIEFENPEQFASLISNELYGNPDASLRSNEFKIGLPTALHLNASKNIAPDHYLNVNLMQRIPLFENSLKRDNILNLSYLIQKQTASYGASVSLYEYKNLRMGGFLRWGPLIIGSENLLPFFVPHKKLKGLDFFIGLKLYPFWEDDILRRSREPCKC